MKNFKKTIAGISALTFTLGLTACGGGDDTGSASTSEATATTTTAATVELNTATYAEEDQKTLDDLANEQLRDVEL
ncbi:MAG: hypothetical protein ACI4RH_00470, partial [Huintestinicola sp.]